ncbi:hypothetical protein HEB94_006711 [Actinopolymorpha pittospori]|uniref:Uncharacterized protein n=1 Tax=Actinopolymorpha pittospori TaxID=648752 RepID=A0A927N2P7_9ACTN|nr:hypothetical protein [Actinopolymorpha pittospori]
MSRHVPRELRPIVGLVLHSGWSRSFGGVPPDAAIAPRRCGVLRLHTIGLAYLHPVPAT